VDWATVRDCLASVGRRTGRAEIDLFGQFVRENQFRLATFQEVQSHMEPLSQLADLFAGATIFSINAFDSFCKWEASRAQQRPLFPMDVPKLSNTTRERCEVLAYLEVEAKKRIKSVSLRSCRRLQTFRPEDPVNFWWYEPQHDLDKAPTKGV